jgi:hypothetical protein
LIAQNRLADRGGILYAGRDQRWTCGDWKITGVAGRAMRWFGKEKPREIWEQATAPAGDIDAAEIIRNICRSAAGSADFVGGFEARADKANRTVQKKHEEQSARYQRAAKAAMEIAMKVSDELMRDAALKEIVELCLKANDTRTAKILFRAVLTPSIRDGMLREHAILQA